MPIIHPRPIAERLVYTALSLLQRGAADKLDLDGVARSAQVDEAEALRLFPGRGDLWVAILEALRVRVMALFAHLALERGDPLEALAELYHIHVRYILRQPATQKLLRSLLVGGNQRLRRRVQQIQSGYAADLALLVASARDQGVIRSEVAAETVAATFLTLVQGTAFRLLAGADPETVTLEAQAQFAVYLDAIRA